MGDDLHARFGADDAGFFAPSDRAGHFRFDLPGYVRKRLALAGVGEVQDMALCTYPPANGFFSYRRATHLGEADYGREISGIVIVR